VDLPSKDWYKKEETDKIWWLDDDESVGEIVFSFDKKTEFNLYLDYPHNLTPEQKELFDKENPFWADYFKDRS
jgi:hypothetical protein